MIDGAGHHVGDDRRDAARINSVLLRELLDLFRAERLLNLIATHGKIGAGAQPGLHLGAKPGRRQLLEQTCEAVAGRMILNQIGEDLRGRSRPARSAARQNSKGFAGKLSKKAHGRELVTERLQSAERGADVKK